MLKALRNLNHQAPITEINNSRRKTDKKILKVLKIMRDQTSLDKINWDQKGSQANKLKSMIQKRVTKTLTDLKFLERNRSEAQNNPVSNIKATKTKIQDLLRPHQDKKINSQKNSLAQRSLLLI